MGIVINFRAKSAACTCRKDHPASYDCVPRFNPNGPRHVDLWEAAWHYAMTYRRRADEEV